MVNIHNLELDSDTVGNYYQNLEQDPVKIKKMILQIFENKYYLKGKGKKQYR